MFRLLNTFQWKNNFNKINNAFSKNSTKRTHKWNEFIYFILFCLHFIIVIVVFRNECFLDTSAFIMKYEG